MSNELEDLPPDNAAPLWAEVQLLTKQREVLETALLKIAYEGHKVTWASAVVVSRIAASISRRSSSSTELSAGGPPVAIIASTCRLYPISVGTLPADVCGCVK